MSLDETGPNAAMKVVTVGDLQRSTSVDFPAIALETGQEPQDRVVVVDLPRRIAASVLPTRDDLALLAHIRRTTDGQGNVDGVERATVVANRLPRADSVSTALLVSVEGRYDGEGFQFESPDPERLVRLIVLKSWQFSCEPRGRNFRQIVTELDRNPPTLRLPDLPSNRAGDTGSIQAANSRLQRGAVALPHYLRQGSETYSWYRGPLSPSQITSRLTHPCPIPRRTASVRFR